MKICHICKAKYPQPHGKYCSAIWPSTLAEQVAKAKTIWDSWTKEVRDSIRLEGNL